MRDDTTTGNDVGILYKEELISNEIHFEPYITEIGNLSEKYGHKEEMLSKYITPPFDKNKIETKMDITW